MGWGGGIISNDADMAETMNICFSNAINNLDIKGYQGILENNSNLDPVNAINKFQNHPSIIKIKRRVETTDAFTFSLSTGQDITKAINQLNTTLSIMTCVHL